MGPWLLRYMTLCDNASFFCFYTRFPPYLLCAFLLASRTGDMIMYPFSSPATSTPFPLYLPPFPSLSTHLLYYTILSLSLPTTPSPLSFNAVHKFALICGAPRVCARARDALSHDIKIFLLNFYPLPRRVKCRRHGWIYTGNGGLMVRGLEGYRRLLVGGVARVGMSGNGLASGICLRWDP
jgi:hypothetical protein